MKARGNYEQKGDRDKENRNILNVVRQQSNNYLKQVDKALIDNSS